MKKIFRRGEERSKALYEDMRVAIQKKDYQQMRRVIRNPDYNPNRVGALDQRTALHTASHEDDREAISILLQQTSIDTNVKTTEGLTPFILAASEGKIDSFEVLLSGSRVDADSRDGKDRSAMELINALDKELKSLKAKELLKKQNNRHIPPKDTAKLALLIGNCQYKANAPPNDSMFWPDLSGPKKDVADMKTRLRADGYQVEVIENSPDLLNSVKDVMNKIPVSSITHLQVLYAGEILAVQGTSQF